MTQKSTERTGNSLLLIFKVGFVILAFLLILKECGTSPAHAKKTDRAYEVYVKLRIGTSWATVKQIVIANSSFDAQRQAQKEAIYSIKTSIQSCKEIR